MSTLTERAKREISFIRNGTYPDVASSHALVAIALALIAIAEELESGKVKEVRDRTWMYERGK